MTKKPLDGATPLGSRWLYVDRIGTEFWFKSDPPHLPSMEVVIIEQPDGSYWQLAFMPRIKMRDMETFAPPYGKRWVFAEDRSYVGVWKRRTSKKFLKQQEML
ncbi:hypothetical protein [Pseudorhodoplanes sp.]|uniref:hypothetical protein n=1 Tax=Pseudorhodoplanes sp. TaxID=1934341 RepID=UPI003D0FA308